jgi:AcrR family transcriptional regulator
VPLKGKTKRDVVCEFRNAEILEAARKVFAQKGFSEASVGDIAQQAGLAKGTLYLYYRSKHALYWAALQAGLVELSRNLKLRVEAEPAIADKIRTFIETKLLYFEENRDFFKIYYAEFANAITHPASTSSIWDNSAF